MEPVNNKMNGFQGNWKWYGIGAVAGVAIILYLRKRGGASASNAASTNSAVSPTGTLSASPLATDSISTLNDIENNLGGLLNSQQALGNQLTSVQAGNTQSFTDLNTRLTSDESTLNALKSSPNSNPANGSAAAPANWGSIVAHNDPGWAAGGGGHYGFIAPDYYGGGGGIGANEVAASVNAQHPGWNLTPQQVIDWNKGTAYFKPGADVYVESYKSVGAPK